LVIAQTGSFVSNGSQPGFSPVIWMTLHFDVTHSDFGALLIPTHS
jgi:hypothetical protein